MKSWNEFKKKIFDENVVLHNIFCGLAIFTCYTLATSAEASPNQWAQEQALIYWITMIVFVVIDIMFNYVLFFED